VLSGVKNAKSAAKLWTGEGSTIIT